MPNHIANQSRGELQGSASNSFWILKGRSVYVQVHVASKTQMYHRQSEKIENERKGNSVTDKYYQKNLFSQHKNQAK